MEFDVLAHQLMAVQRIGFPGLGDRLRRARDEAALTQEVVAEIIGVSWMTVHRWERGERTVPEIKLKRLCDLYGKTATWFLTLEEGDLEISNAQFETPRRVYRRIADSPAKYHPMVERMVDQLLQGLKATEQNDQ